MIHFFLDNQSVIDVAVQQTDEQFAWLSDETDEQNIHFDLNATNFLIDSKNRVRIMDDDNVQLGNIYMDIGFALHCLVVPAIEWANNICLEIIEIFLDSYKKGNPSLELNLNKLITAILIARYKISARVWI